MAKRRHFDPASIKRRALKAMFSDDDLMDQLVLKGGNLLDVVFEISTRASVDLDFSMAGEFEGPELLQAKIQASLQRAFLEIEVVTFDVQVAEKPKPLSPELAAFWGGYQVDFKIVEKEVFDEFSGELEEIRRRAIAIGKEGSTKFEIDISKHEYCDDKQPFDLDHLRIFTYSPEMVVCEKLRAICQQMPEYVSMVMKHPAGRARDFVDIYDVCQKYRTDFSSDAMKRILRRVFQAKRVALNLLCKLSESRDFHAPDFASVAATVNAGVELKTFDFYFNYVLESVASLEPLGDE